MTNRELLYGFYRHCRLLEREKWGLFRFDQQTSDELYIELIAAAARAGLSNMEIESLAFDAAHMLVDRERGCHEPTSYALKIQMMQRRCALIRDRRAGNV